VVASGTGRTAAEFARELDLNCLCLVGVKMARTIDRIYNVEPDPEACSLLRERGVPLVGGVHALTGGIDHAIASEALGSAPGTLVAHTLYLFSQGMKVAVEIVLMAHDHGLLDDGEEVLACAGTGTGCDTVILVKAAGSAKLFDLRVLKILAKPPECAIE
jgi:hypothetical protein